MNLILRDLFYNKICSSCMISNRLRVKLYKVAGVKIEQGVVLCPHIFLGNSNIEIGESTFINYNVWMNTAGGIRIGKKCNIAMNVSFITSTHKIGTCERRAGESYAESIEVGDGCWIGAGSIILPGLTIGNGTIIAAGSVVNSNCEANALYGGIPAKMIRKLE